MQGLASFLAAVALLVACGGDDPAPRAAGGGAGSSGAGGGVGGASGTTGSSGKAGSSGVGGAPGDPCAEDTDPPAPGAVCLATVRGKLVDFDGAPVPDKLVTVCGVGCFYGKSAADGAWATPIGARLLPREYVVFAHGGPTHATLLVELDAALQGPDVVVADPVRVPALPLDGPQLPADDGPGGDVVSAGLTLRVAAKTKIDLDIEDLALGEPGRRFRAVRVELEDLPPFAKEMGAAFAYAISPSAADLSLAAAVEIDGAGSLAAGQKVELFVQEDNFLGEPSIIGRARVVGTGHVSADGKKITSDPGVGLTHLNWIGVRAAP